MGNIQTVQAIYEAFGRGDIRFILDQLRADVCWEDGGADHGIPWLVPGRGMEHVQHFFGIIGPEFEFQLFDVDAVTAGGSVVMVLINLKATVRSTGRLLEDTEVHVWKFDDEGKVASFRHVVDTIRHRAAATSA